MCTSTPQRHWMAAMTLECDDGYRYQLAEFTGDNYQEPEQLYIISLTNTDPTTYRRATYRRIPMTYRRVLASICEDAPLFYEQGRFINIVKYQMYGADDWVEIGRLPSNIDSFGFKISRDMLNEKAIEEALESDYGSDLKVSEWEMAEIFNALPLRTEWINWYQSPEGDIYLIYSPIFPWYMEEGEKDLTPLQVSEQMYELLRPYLNHRKTLPIGYVG